MKTQTKLLEVEGPSVAPIESENTTNNRLGAQRHDWTPERTDEATIEMWALLPSIAGARARVVSPPSAVILKKYWSMVKEVGPKEAMNL